MRAPPLALALLLGLSMLAGVSSEPETADVNTRFFKFGEKVVAAPRTAPPVDDAWPGWNTVYRDDRFNHFLSHLQFHLVPNFTETGYQVSNVERGKKREKGKRKKKRKRTKRKRR